MQRCEAIEKIKKCLALSTSGNEHEAGAALRQAQKLMEKYGLTTADIDAAGATEAVCRSGSRAEPRGYIVGLGQTVARAFACEIIFRRVLNHGGRDTQCVFIGVAPKPEIAAYAYTVLKRNLERDRRAYVATLWRCQRATKTRRSQVFADCWVMAVVHTVREFAGTDEDRRMIRAYKERAFSSIRTAGVKPTKVKASDLAAAERGVDAGSKVSLRHAVRASDQPARLGRQ